MKNMNIINVLNGIEHLKQSEKEYGKSKFSVAVGFKLLKNEEALTKAYRPYIDYLTRLQEEYYLKGKNGKYNILKEGMSEQEYNTKLLELLNSEQDVKIEKIQYEDLEKCHDLTLADQQALFFMLED
ncbi:MAG: hypothetical protein ACI4C1_08675 [Lachnospiraceae bacterium]